MHVCCCVFMCSEISCFNILICIIILSLVYSLCSGGFWIIGVLFALITLPIIGYFVYSVIKDPVTPSVLKNAVDVWKEKYFGYISQNKSSTDLDDTHSTEHERVRNNIIETPRSLNMRRNMHNRSKYVNIEEEEYQEGNS